MRDGYGRTLKKHRTLPNQCRNYRQEKEEKMTEEERTQAQKRLERRLQELDSQRLSRGSTGSRIEKKFVLDADVFCFVCAGYGCSAVCKYLIIGFRRSG